MSTVRLSAGDEPPLIEASMCTFFGAVGLLVLVASVAAWASPPLRHLERDVPDVAQSGDPPVTENPGV